jgi:hypothetical protein
MSVFLLTLILFININVHASDSLREKCFTHPIFGSLYEQSKPIIQNHLEDVALLNRARMSRENLLNELNVKTIDEAQRSEQVQWLEKNCSEFLPKKKAGPIYASQEQVEDLEKCRSQLYDEKLEELKCDIFNVSRKAPFKTKELTNELMAQIKKFEEAQKTKSFVGEFHQWEKTEKKKLVAQFPPSLVFSKILTALALGVTSKYLMTEKDQELREWLEKQSLVSVSPTDLFYQSLVLQNGDVYKALLSIENVLSEFWKSPNRNAIVQTTSLMSITNHCPGETKEDVFGSWYHMFGMMLYGCVHGPVAAQIVGRTEAAGGRILDAKSVKKNGQSVLLHLLIGSDPQEEKINRLSGLVGNQVCRQVKNSEKTKDSEYVDPKNP